MIEERATVTACREAGYAEVQALRQTACGDCEARSGCGAKALSGIIGNRRMVIRALNPIDARPGEEVVIGVREAAIAKASLAAYLAPLVGLIAFALFGQWLGLRLEMANPETYSIAGGLLGLSLGLGWLRRFSARLTQDGYYQAVILRRSGMTTRPGQMVTPRDFFVSDRSG